MKTYQSDIYAFVGGCIRCRVGSVSARSHKFGGCGGLGFWLVRNHAWTEKLCLLITMSRCVGIVLAASYSMEVWVSEEP